MAVKASVTITISKYRDTNSITRYYKLQASTAAAPAVPTTLSPSGWSTSEPTYTSGSTNTLYYTDCVIFSDGTFQYTDDGNGKAVKSSSYEAAKEAYNKAQAAQNSATSANNKIDNLQIGGRNLLTESSLLSAPTKNANWSEGRMNQVTSSSFINEGLKVITPQNSNYNSGSVIVVSKANNLIKAGEILTFSIDIKGKTSQGHIYGFFRGNGKNFWDNHVNIVSSTATTSEDWHRYSGSFIMPNTGTGDPSFYIDLGQGSNSDEVVTRIYKNAKLELGNIATDWSPAPEDMNIDNLQIGGRNLLLGTGTASGDVSNGNGSKVENLDLYNGISGVKTNIMWSERYMNLKAVASRGGFNIGDNLVASVYIKSDSNITCDVSFHRSTGTGNIDGSTKTYNSVTITPEWKQYWFPFVADEGSLNRTDTRIEINKSTGDNYVYWAGWKLEKGNKATDWTPAPEDMNDAIKSVVNLYYSSNSSTLPTKPTTHITTNNTTTRNAWNIGLPTYDEQYPYLYTCKEVLNKGGTYSWTTVNQTTYSEAIKTIQTELDAVQADYLKESTFSTYKREQIKNDQKIEQRLSKTEVTVYGDPENPDDPKALINHIQKVDNDINGSGGLDDRLGAAEGTIEGTGLNEYDQRVKITQRFLNVETDVESIKNIFNITGGTNLIQNSVGYFASNNKPSMWDIASNTIYTPFGYDGDLTGVTVSRGKLFCAKGSITTTTNNIIALLSNKMVSISFKYKNGANATSKIKIFNGSIIYFEKAFNTTVNQWTEYRFDPDIDPILANPTFLNTSNSLQISIESTNSTDNNGFEISDLMLNYGNVKPWELYSNEVYGAMVKLSSLGIEVTATTANTKNFMTTDGILVYRYDSKTDKIIGTEPITKITDNGTITNKLESTGDIIERNLIQTVIKDSSNKDIYVEYIR